ncbi:MAG TPA: hypothetical protein VF129_02630 [Actinomycetota bacterium]
MSTTARLTIVSFALAMMAASCSEPDDRPLPSVSSAFPADPGPGLTAGTGTAGTPTGPTEAEPDVPELTRGRITIQLSGEVEAEATLDQVISAVYSPPPGALAIVWTTGTDATVVGLGGASFIGTRRTSPTLTLTITAQTGADIVSFVSVDGECEVEILVAERDRVFGSFTCSGLTSSIGRVADVSASFEAAR